MVFLNRGYRPFVEEDPLEQDPTPATPIPFPTQVYNPGGGTPPGGTGGGGGGAGGGGGGGGFGGPGDKPLFNFAPVPGFTPPDFNRPSATDAFNEPGYQFRLQSGSDALQRSAAAKGLLRTGGTLKDITEYGQNFASNEYGNVFNRALSAYDRKYQGAKDRYAPQLAQWNMLSQAELQAALAQFGNQHQNNYHPPNIPPPPDPPDVSQFHSNSELWPE